MKDLFEIKKGDEKTEFYDLFFVREQDNIIKESLDGINDDLEKQNKNSTLPTPLAILMYILFIIGIFIIGLFFKLTEDRSISDVWKEEKNLIFIGLGLIILAAVIYLYKIYKFKHTTNSDDFKELVENGDTVIADALNEFNFSLDDPNIDFFISLVKEKNGKVKKALSVNSMLICVYAKVMDNSLYLSDIYNLYKIDLSEIKGLEKVEEKISFIGWNKDIEPNKGKYKEYKIVIQNNILTMKYYYKLIIEHDFNTYFIKIPAYDGDILSEILEIQK